MLKREKIQIRDPYILVHDGMYYLYGTTDKNCWSDKGTGFDSYKSKDLENWEGPFTAFKPSEDFWADRHFWRFIFITVDFICLHHSRVRHTAEQHRYL